MRITPQAMVVILAALVFGDIHQAVAKKSLKSLLQKHTTQSVAEPAPIVLLEESATLNEPFLDPSIDIPSFVEVDDEPKSPKSQSFIPPHLADKYAALDKEVTQIVSQAKEGKGPLIEYQKKQEVLAKLTPEERHQVKQHERQQLLDKFDDIKKEAQHRKQEAQPAVSKMWQVFERETAKVEQKAKEEERRNEAAASESVFESLEKAESQVGAGNSSESPSGDAIDVEKWLQETLQEDAQASGEPVAEGISPEQLASSIMNVAQQETQQDSAAASAQEARAEVDNLLKDVSAGETPEPPLETFVLPSGEVVQLNPEYVAADSDYIPVPLGMDVSVNKQTLEDGTVVEYASAPVDELVKEIEQTPSAEITLPDGTTIEYVLPPAANQPAAPQVEEVSRGGEYVSQVVSPAAAALPPHLTKIVQAVDEAGNVWEYVEPRSQHDFPTTEDEMLVDYVTPDGKVLNVVKAAGDVLSQEYSGSEYASEYSAEPSPAAPRLVGIAQQNSDGSVTHFEVPTDLSDADAINMEDLLKEDSLESSLDLTPSVTDYVPLPSIPTPVPEYISEYASEYLAQSSSSFSSSSSTSEYIDSYMSSPLAAVLTAPAPVAAPVQADQHLEYLGEYQDLVSSSEEYVNVLPEAVAEKLEPTPRPLGGDVEIHDYMQIDPFNPQHEYVPPPAPVQPVPTIPPQDSTGLLPPAPTEVPSPEPSPAAEYVAEYEAEYAEPQPAPTEYVSDAAVKSILKAAGLPHLDVPVQLTPEEYNAVVDRIHDMQVEKVADKIEYLPVEEQTRIDIAPLSNQLLSNAMDMVDEDQPTLPPNIKPEEVAAERFHGHTLKDDPELKDLKPDASDVAQIAAVVSII